MKIEICLMEEIAKLQMDYNNLKLNNQLTKKTICDLIIPFRDKYCLSDKDALAIARNEMSIIDMVDAIRFGTKIKLAKILKL